MTGYTRADVEAALEHATFRSDITATAIDEVLGFLDGLGAEVRPGDAPCTIWCPRGCRGCDGGPIDRPASRLAADAIREVVAFLDTESRDSVSAKEVAEKFGVPFRGRPAP